MQSVSGSTSRHATPFLIRRKQRRIIIISLGILLVAGLVFFGYRAIVRYSARLQLQRANLVSPQTILAAWNERDYDLIIRETSAVLQERPVDAFFLAFNGFALYYSALRTNDGEQRIAMMRDSVSILRKALLVGIPELTPQIHYVVGKASYYRGREFYDDCIRFLNQALELGYSSSDIWEYLALAYRELGLLDDSLAAFSKAISAHPDSMPLILAAAKVSQQTADTDQAYVFAQKVWVDGQDQFLQEQAGLILASIFLGRDQYPQALEILETIKKRNADSADAWYYEGLVYQKMNDLIRARAAWRRAVAIDPMHVESRNKLNERL